jgi:hypothetical protein
VILDSNFVDVSQAAIIIVDMVIEVAWNLDEFDIYKCSIVQS